MSESQKEAWHLDKRVPVAMIFAIVLQTLGFGFWVGQLSNRVDTIESWVTDNRRTDARLAVVEAGLADMKANLADIKRILERIANNQEREP